MRLHWLLLLAFATSFAYAHLHSDHDHSHAEELYNIRKECPLCGMDVDDDRSVQFLGNQTIYFCMMRHDIDFLEHPSRFMEVTVVPEPDEATIRDHGQGMACPVCGMSVPSLTGPDNRINVGDNKDSKQYIHTCSAGCAEMVVSDPNAYINHDHHAGGDSDEYCWGGLTMFHSGFTFDTDPCVILMFEEWTLDSETKLWFGVIGSFLGGLLHEAFTMFRASIRKACLAPLSRGASEEEELCPSTDYGKSGKCPRRGRKGRALAARVILALMYGLSITWGYFLMLICMTYHAGLFLAVVLGLTCGHFVFRWDAPVSDREDPCCEDDL